MAIRFVVDSASDMLPMRSCKNTWKTAPKSAAFAAGSSEPKKSTDTLMSVGAFPFYHSLLTSSTNN